MTQRPYIDNRPPGRQPGDRNALETWWVERQEALEAVGYMLRPRYRPGWIPSWRGTNKFYLDAEDGPSVWVCVLCLPGVCAHEFSLDAPGYGRYSNI